MKITTLFGTRPETIKMAPFILEGKKLNHEVKVIFTGQHREMALPLLKFFDITPDADLNLMVPNQSLSALSAKMLKVLNEVPGIRETDAIVVQGDTTSAFVGAYWAFLNQIPVIHLEAGLRTYDLSAPFPEEANRQLISRIARVHLAPTPEALLCIQNEGISKNAYMIGNTGLDTLRIVSERIDDNHLPEEIRNFIGNQKLILVTVHRRENFGEGMVRIAQTIKEMALIHPEVKIIFPVHLNPNVANIMKQKLQNIQNLKLVAPMDYLPFVALMKKANVILTDSGGIQEEAPTLKVPVVVMRESTERPEGVSAGFATLTGSDPAKILEAVEDALKYGCRGSGANPYGDGYSSNKAWQIITDSGVIL